MKVNDVILSIRAKLGDEGQKKRWEDEVLIDSINSALSAIVEEVNPWNDGKWIVPLINGKSSYELPPYFYKLNSIMLNGHQISQDLLVSYERLKSADNTNFLVAQTINNLHVKPAIFNEAGADKLLVYYDREEQIAYIGDQINLPERFKDAIVFYALHLLVLDPVKKNGEEKSVFYLNLFKEKVKNLRASTFRNRHSRRIRTPHVSV